ncbi:hypothetical protein [Catelliglobosispora koreensis]|uniref:hypothetical protein n=1 Tax=Catelliglobosispora koreensis TaxID=129052 RepID=UPI00036F889D|nr:hypothetical protein [Catelliglobosispora koreensis]
MTLEEVRATVAYLASLTGERYDPEASHEDTDKLYVGVLQAVAEGHPDAVEMATEALKVETFDLERWYA